MGATEGSAHGGASPSVNSAGSGCPPGPKARDSPGRRLGNFVLFLRHFPTSEESLPLSPYPFQVLRLRFSFHVSILASPRVSPPLLPSVSVGFLPLPCVRFSPPIFPLTRPRFNLYPPTRVYLFSFQLALPFLASGLSDLLAVAFASTDAPALPRYPFGFRFYRLGFEARFCGPRLAPKRPSHHSPGAAKNTGTREAHKHFANLAVVHWK